MVEFLADAVGVIVGAAVLLLALPVVLLVLAVVGVVVIGAIVLAAVASAVGLGAALFAVASSEALPLVVEGWSQRDNQVYWRTEGSVGRAQSFLGGWCAAECDDRQAPYAVGGFLSCYCTCSSESAMPRELPSIDAQQRRLANRFIRWAQTQSSPALRELGQAAEAVLAAYDAGDRHRFEAAERRFWTLWMGLAPQDWKAAAEWRQEHVSLWSTLFWLFRPSESGQSKSSEAVQYPQASP
ncbi:MAG: hypothetical protein NZ960_03830 [Candidatus Kapabacteria bacterium]|nr:hypothetical protein [Candidatus Kapabacteria bacterium]MDW8012216.1 hypothetical protein [Bacteroidota bacterium]